MGYLFLAIALLAGTAKGYCGKQISAQTRDPGSAAAVNLVRMVLCIVIGFGLVLAAGDTRKLLPRPELLLIMALSGVMTSVFVISWLLCVRKSAYMLVDVFLMLGALIPLLFGQILFREAVRPIQWVGFGVLVVAVLILCSHSSAIKGKLSLSGIALLILCGASNGLTDFSQKLFSRYGADSSVAVFNFYTYVFSAITLGVYSLLSSGGKSGGGGMQVLRSHRVLCFVAVMSVCLFLNSYFKTTAALYLDSMLLYPLNNCLALAASTAMSAVLFGEKITLRAIVGLVLAAGALLLIHVL